MYTLFLPMEYLIKNLAWKPGKVFVIKHLYTSFKISFSGATKIGSFFTNKKIPIHFDVRVALNRSPFSPG